jgi:hypothetical protein
VAELCHPWDRAATHSFFIESDIHEQPLGWLASQQQIWVRPFIDVANWVREWQQRRGAVETSIRSIGNRAGGTLAAKDARSARRAQLGPNLAVKIDLLNMTQCSRKPFHAGIDFVASLVRFTDENGTPQPSGTADKFSFALRPFLEFLGAERAIAIAATEIAWRGSTSRIRKIDARNRPQAIHCCQERAASPPIAPVTAS